MRTDRRVVWWFVAASIAVWAALFGRFVIGQSCFGYRDTAHLYYPLFEWAQEQWGRGEVPLWNPLDDFGGPLLADGTSSIFYPLKAIFFLNFVPFPSRFATFVSLHFLIAAWGAYWLARTLQCSPAGGLIAAFGFALSGAVLFQVNNVVFFIGAAWLPWALAAGWAALGHGGLRQACWCGFFVALMVLGGDPQSGYHVFLILAATAFFGGDEDMAKSGGLFHARRTLIVGLILAVAAATSAVQWMPTWQWQQRSIRANHEIPFTVVDSTNLWLQGQGFGVDGWFMPPPPDSHHDHIYQFSQPPWSLAELIWPNISGKGFPIFRRWSAAIPAADRVWTPSLYMGLGTLVFAICGMRLWGRRTASIGLSWMTIAFALGSFGWFGFGWIARELDAFLQWNWFTKVPGPIGGVYWWMATILPGYANFRYPAKLFVVASLGLSLLAGRELTSLNAFRARRLGWFVTAIATLTLLALLLSYCLPVSEWMSRVGGDAMFGPFDVAGSLRDLRITFAHSVAVSVAIGIVLRVFATGQRRQHAAVGVVSITLFDLLIANAWLAVGIPTNSSVQAQAGQVPIVRSTDSDLPRIRRFYMDSVLPKTWRTTSSADRLVEVNSFQRQTFFPKFHLSRSVGLIGSFRSIEPLDLSWFDSIAGEGLDAALGIGYQISDASQRSIADTREILKRDETSLVMKAAADARAVFIESASLDESLQKSRLTFADRERFAKSVRRDLAALRQAKAGAIDRIRDISANRVDVHVTADGAGWLVLKDYWDAGWVAMIDDTSTGTTVVCRPKRYAGIFRAVQIPRAGNFVVRFVYRPGEFFWGAAISIAALSVFCWLCARPARSKVRS